jgi:hypothetical protein
MRVRFQADADLNQVIVQAVLRQEPNIDFQTARRAGLERLDDRAVLAKAATDGRILVTHERKTMPRHFAEFVAQEQSPGVVLVAQNLSIRRAVEDLVLIWGCTQSEEWVNRIYSLPI